MTPTFLLTVLISALDPHAKNNILPPFVMMIRMSDIDDIKKRAEIYKLSIAKDSIDEAARTAGLVIGNRINEYHPLYRPLHAAMVIAYGRAFSEMKPFWKISHEWSQFEDPNDQRVHNALMRQRNTMVGHADHIPNKILIHPKGAVMDDGEVLTAVQTDIGTNYIPPEDFTYIQRTAGGLVARMSITISELMTELYGNEGVNITETIELVSEEDVKMLNEEKNKKGST